MRLNSRTFLLAASWTLLSAISVIADIAGLADLPLETILKTSGIVVTGYITKRAAENATRNLKDKEHG